MKAEDRLQSGAVGRGRGELCGFRNTASEILQALSCGGGQHGPLCTRQPKDFQRPLLPSWCFPEPFHSVCHEDSSACAIGHATVTQVPSSSSPPPCTDHGSPFHHAPLRLSKETTNPHTQVCSRAPGYLCCLPLSLLHAWPFFIALATYSWPLLAWPVPYSYLLSSRAAGLACFTCS